MVDAGQFGAFAGYVDRISRIASVARHERFRFPMNADILSVLNLLVVVLIVAAVIVVVMWVARAAAAPRSSSRVVEERRPLVAEGTGVLLRVGIRTKTIRTYRATSMDVCGRQRLVLQAEPLILTRR
jgi:hypothetical protein